MTLSICKRHDQAVLWLGLPQEKLTLCPPKPCTRMFFAALFIILQQWKQSTSTLAIRWVNKPWSMRTVKCGETTEKHCNTRYYAERENPKTKESTVWNHMDNSIHMMFNGIYSNRPMVKVAFVVGIDHEKAWQNFRGDEHTLWCWGKVFHGLLVFSDLFLAPKSLPLFPTIFSGMFVC